MNIVADTGPLIALAKIRNLGLLKLLFDNVNITTAVYKELLAKTGYEASEIENALEEFIIIKDKIPTIKRIKYTLKDLGAGEKQSIEFIYSNKENSVLIIDDKAGRKVAKELNIPIMGTISVLVLAKKKEMIKSVTELLLEMREKGYWLSEEIIQLARKITDE
jgi:hypothetical protein